MAAETGTMLWARALDRADMTGSAFADATQALIYVNDALSELYGALVATGSDWFYKESTQAITAGIQSYTLPTDFYKMLKVYATLSGVNYRVRRYNRDEVSGADATPQSSASFTLCYVPAFTELTSLSTLISTSITTPFPIGWFEYVALCIAIKLLIKEESDPGALMAERDRKFTLLMQQAAPRDEGEPDTVVDVSGRWQAPEYDTDNTANGMMYRVQGSKLYVYQAKDE